MDQPEDTLVLLKPDALERGLVGEIIQRFEKVKLKIIALLVVRPDLAKVEKHYTDLRAKNPRAFDRNTRYLAGKNVIALAIGKVRTLIGPTEPASAPPGTIRGDLSSDTIAIADAEDRGLFNLVHASDSIESAKKEIDLWFSSAAKSTA
jgi:nucleoside-diphosphate kinase